MSTDYDGLQVRYRQLQLRKARAWDHAERLRQQYEAAYEAYLDISRQEHKAMVDLGVANEARGNWRRVPPEPPRPGVAKRLFSRLRYRKKS